MHYRALLVICSSVRPQARCNMSKSSSLTRMFTYADPSVPLKIHRSVLDILVIQYNIHSYYNLKDIA